MCQFQPVRYFSTFVISSLQIQIELALYLNSGIDQYLRLVPSVHDHLQSFSPYNLWCLNIFFIHSCAAGARAQNIILVGEVCYVCRII